MAVRKEKKCFSSFYAKTQQSDYIIHVLDAFESQKNRSQKAQTTYHYYSAYDNNSNELTIQETAFV